MSKNTGDIYENMENNNSEDDEMLEVDELDGAYGPAVVPETSLSDSTAEETQQYDQFEWNSIFTTKNPRTIKGMYNLGAARELKIKQLERTVGAFDEQEDNYQNEISEELATAQAKYNILENFIEEIEGCLPVVKSKYDIISSEMKKTLDNMEVSEGKVDILNKNLENGNESELLEAAIETLRQAETTNADLRNMLEQSEAEKAEQCHLLKDGNDKLKKEVDDMNAKYAALKIEVNNNLARLENANRNKQQIQDSATAQIGSLQEQALQLQANENKLKNELNTKRETIKTMYHDVEKNSNIAKNFHKELTDYTLENEELKKQLAKHRDLKDKLQKSHSDISERIKNAEQSYAKEIECLEQESERSSTTDQEEVNDCKIKIRNLEIAIQKKNEEILQLKQQVDLSAKTANTSGATASNVTRKFFTSGGLGPRVASSDKVGESSNMFQKSKPTNQVRPEKKRIAELISRVNLFSSLPDYDNDSDDSDTSVFVVPPRPANKKK